MDRELTRAELDELVPLYALDALDGEERAQVARYVERDDDARAEVESLREAVSFLPPRETPAPASLWEGIEHSLDVPSVDIAAPPLRLVAADSATSSPARESRLSRRVVAMLAAAAVILAAVLGIQVLRQQDRIDDLAAEMHRDPMEQQAMAARGSSDAHVIALDAMDGDAVDGAAGAEVVMLPDGTGYLMGHVLPTLDADGTYQLWARVGDGTGTRMVSLGLLGRAPGTSPFRLTATPSMFEVTKEPATGSEAPGTQVVLRGEVA
ncbi:MAG TPA: anti-sigma factor [Acidimicrobiia bacterium]